MPKLRVVVPLQTSEEIEPVEYLDSTYTSAIDNLIQKALFPESLSPYLKQGPLALLAVLSLPRNDLFGIGYLIANDTDTCKNMECQNGLFNPLTSTSLRPIPTPMKQHISRIDAWSRSKATATATSTKQTSVAVSAQPTRAPTPIIITTSSTVVTTNLQGYTTLNRVTKTGTQTITPSSPTPTPDPVSTYILQEQDKADIVEAFSSAMPRLFDRLLAPSPSVTATMKTKEIPASKVETKIVETSIPGPWIGGGNITVRFYEANLTSDGDKEEKVNGTAGNLVGQGVWGWLVVVIGMMVLL